MNSEHKCQKCGKSLGAFAVGGGLCPACLLLEGVAPSPATVPLSAPAAHGMVRYFGDYELLEEIARGGMGVVYRARQVSLNRTVAVKMILSGQLASAAEVQRFRHEAEAAAKLQHPNIVAIYEVGEHEGRQYFSMEYIEGRNLAELVDGSPLPAARAAGYVKATAEAIHYAHQKGVLHRDLKPSNVLVDGHNQPRVTDFGLAKQVASGSNLTVSGQVLGTPNYMPPEQAGGRRREAGPHSDVYGLGAVRFFLLTGRPPFLADSLEATLHAVLALSRCRRACSIPTCRGTWRRFASSAWRKNQPVATPQHRNWRTNWGGFSETNPFALGRSARQKDLALVRKASGGCEFSRGCSLGVSDRFCWCALAVAARGSQRRVPPPGVPVRCHNENCWIAFPGMDNHSDLV
jgi:serine/threonine protein kinase